MALLATVRPSIKRLGDEHIRLAGDEGSVALDKHFIVPPLTKPKRVSDYDKPENDDDERSEDYSISDLLEADTNFILLGKPEAGKTALIHYMALKLVTDSFSTPRLPLRAKFYDFQRGNQPIWRAVRAYANEISDGKITAGMVQRIPLVIFVDEVVQGDDGQLSYLLGLIKETKNIRWILLANGYGQLATVSAENEKKLASFTTVSINELSRGSIRKLSAQWLDEEVDGEATNRLFNKVMEHIARSGLPRSGYIVSLILWTFRKGLAGELINEAVLLENIIDHMLGKMEYTGALRSEFDFTSKVAVLQELAINLRKRNQSVTKNEVVATVIDYLQRKGLRYDGGKIVDGFIDCGILSEIDDLVEFRYSRFEEYFTSGYIRDNRESFNAVLAAESWNGYAREMDLYTSRFRNDAFLLAEGRKKVDAVKIPVPRLEGDALHQYLSNGGDFKRAAKRLKRMKKEPMSARKIDELRDKADATVTRRRSSLNKRKKSAEENISNVRRFTDALEVYTRFIRNLEFADSSDKRLHLDHCLNLWEQHTKLLISGLNEAFREMRDDIATDPKVDDEIRDDITQIATDIENQVKCMIPALVATSLYESIGTEKLSIIIKHAAENQESTLLKRLLASFVLLDIDPSKGMELMSSDGWHRSMNNDWVCSVVETRLHKYYLEQHLAGTLRQKFERLVAAIEARLTGTKFQSDRMKDVVVKRLAKSSIVATIKEKNSSR
ncbi:MAG: hypothetical protein EOP06_03375 [Proteobacteria bacterium]|nr:MAG: hypothetical protein EOP06_03375 [Pseudomonadota bacterium]